jgi:uncharacterized membrane protein
MRWLWLILSLATVGAFAAELAYHGPRLPQRVASHFDASGEPDGWNEKRQFLSTTVTAFTIITMSAFTIPALVWLLPTSMINMPDARYWLAPERASATKPMLVQRAGWLCCATILLGLGICDALLRANLAPQPHVRGIWLPIIGYFAFFVVWLSEMI